MSPLLKALQEKARMDSIGAQQEFWEKARISGIPLTETLPGEENYSLLTFIYRDSSSIKKVRLESNINALLINGITLNFDEMGWMKRLEHSNVWYLSFRVKNDLRVPYLFEIHKDQPGQPTLKKETVTDPFNPNVYMPGNNRLRQSVAEMSRAPHFPGSLQDSTRGKWLTIQFLSVITKKQEKFFVYLSPAIDTFSKTGYPLVIGLEAYSFGVAMPADRIIDELSSSKQITPPVFISVDYKSFNDQADLDSLSLFLFDEVLPLLRKRFPVSHKAGDMLISGTSRRGLAAAYLAFRHPDKVKNVLSMSGSFFWKPSGETEYEWLSRQIASNKKKDLRFYIAAGSLENVVTARNYGHYMVATNRHLRDVLTAKAYSFLYYEYEGVHHELNWQYAFYNGLKYLLSPE